MTSIVSFRPLLGAHNEGPLCYLLELDGCRLLLDCGWDERFEIEDLKLLKDVAAQVDAVLISHPDITHLGALPYAYGKLGLNCPIYATTAAHQMGQLFMYDVHESRFRQEEFTTFSLDDVDDVFAKFKVLTFNQSVQLENTGIVITPYVAGHMLGGSVWRLASDDEDIIYAPDYNHRSERHLEPTVFEVLRKPFMLITGALNALQAPRKQRERDEELVETIYNTVRDDGTLVLVSDTAGRSLELLQFLDKIWSDKSSSLASYPLLLSGVCAYNSLEFAKTLIEYMSPKITKALESARRNPFDLVNVQLKSRIEDINLLNGPKVILVSNASLEAGISRELFLQLCEDKRSRFLFTTRPSPGTLGHQLLTSHTQGDAIEMRISSRVALEGEELHEHRMRELEQKEEAARREQEALAAMQEDSDDEDMEAVDAEQQPSHHTQFKSHRAINAVFADDLEEQDWDDYGVPIDEADFAPLQPTKAEQADALLMNAEEVEETKDKPTKVIERMARIVVNINVSYVDLEGLSDGESIKMKIVEVNPRHLILIHGSTKSTQSLGEACSNNEEMEGLERVETPKLGQIVDVTQDSNVFQVNIRDALFASLNFRDVNGYQVAHVDGAILLPEAMDSKHLPELVAPQHVAEHEPSFIGNLRLSQLKKQLEEKGIEAVFQGGQLICADKLLLGKKGDKVTMEGPFCAEYFAVREILYDQFALA